MIDPISAILAQADEKMVKAAENLDRELAGIRTGRASPALVEHLRVDYHGVPTPLNQLAGITTPEPRLITIQPWDRATVGAIEKAILKSDLGLNPANDGRVIRLPIPQLTEERRKELVRMVRKRVEEGRVTVRNLRRDTMEELRARERKGEIAEDDHKRAQERLQQLTDGFIAQLNSLGEDKEAELMEV